MIIGTCAKLSLVRTCWQRRNPSMRGMRRSEMTASIRFPARSARASSPSAASMKLKFSACNTAESNSRLRTLSSTMRIFIRCLAFNFRFYPEKRCATQCKRGCPPFPGARPWSLSALSVRDLSRSRHYRRRVLGKQCRHIGNPACFNRRACRRAGGSTFPIICWRIRHVFGHQLADSVFYLFRLEGIHFCFQTSQRRLDHGETFGAMDKAHDAPVAGGAEVFSPALELLEQFLSGSQAHVLDFDIHVGHEAGKLDHLAGQSGDFDRHSHIKHEDLPSISLSATLQYQTHGFGNGHEVADHIWMGNRHRPARCDLSREGWHHTPRGAQHVSETNADELGAPWTLGKHGLQVDFGQSL